MDAIFDLIQEILYSHHLNVSTLLMSILYQDTSDKPCHPIVQEVLAGWKDFLTAFVHHRDVGDSVKAWLIDEAVSLIDEDVNNLAVNSTEWCFTAGHAELYQLQEFDIADMALEMRVQAPRLWRVLDRLIVRRKATNTRIDSEESDDEMVTEALDSHLGDSNTPSRPVHGDKRNAS